MILTLAAFVKTFRALADGSMSITLETQELSPSEMGDLSKCLKKFGVFVFKPEVDKLSEKEIKAIESVDLRISDEGGKTPSQRLRGVFYKLFEKNNEGFDNFDAYYLSKMNKLVSHYKKLLDE